MYKYGHVFLFIRYGIYHIVKHSEKRNKTKPTKEEVGRQHLGMDRSGDWQVPEGNGEEGQLEKTSCKAICGAPMTSHSKGTGDDDG